MATEEVPETLARLATEADTLRRAVVFDGDVGDSVTTLHERAIAMRRSQDRLEEITATLGRMRSQARRIVADAQDAYDDKVAEAIAGSQREEYSTAVERNASYDLVALAEKIKLRRAKRVLSQVDEVYEFVNMKNRGLIGARFDMDGRFRMMSFEMRLEA